MIEEYKALLEQFNFFLNKLFSLLNKTQRNKQKNVHNNLMEIMMTICRNIQIFFNLDTHMSKHWI